MTFDEDYLTLLGQVNHLTTEITGTGIVDAYFGPKRLSPGKTRAHLAPDKLLTELDMLIGKCKEIDNVYRRIALASDLQSVRVVVKWLSGEDFQYTRLVEGIFGITPSKFGEKEIRNAQKLVEDASSFLRGSDVSAKILKWRQKSKISGETLKKMIDKEIVAQTHEMKRQFETQVFSHFPTRVQNKGIIYKTVAGEPWTAYNYYQGNYTSINAINVDKPFNKYMLAWALAHEYEHHVANLFAEKYCRENKALDLAALLLHSRRSVISEGTADCARNFLGLQFEEGYGQLVESLITLGNMVRLNVAYMTNVEKADAETAAEYLATESLVSVEDAKKTLAFSNPLTPAGKLNFFSPYVYTCYFGKRDYVLPAFQEAQKEGKVKEFFQTLYLNPYSRSSATWKTAFAEIYNSHA